jgi:hypothetical protein
MVVGVSMCLSSSGCSESHPLKNLISTCH